MARFDTVRETTHRFGTNSYVELARRRLVDEKGASIEFLVLTRGFIDEDGAKRWTRFVTLPDEPALLAWVMEALRSESAGVTAPVEASSGSRGERV